MEEGDRLDGVADRQEHIFLKSCRSTYQGGMISRKGLTGD